jgi:hypothetical protein
MRTRAKFYLGGLTLLPGLDAGIQVNLNAVARGDRNASWAKATPIGQMSMTIQNPAAVKQWEEFMRAARETGKQPELFIDIYPSEDGWPGDGHLWREAEFPEGHYDHGKGKCGECGYEKDIELTSLGTTAHPNG